MNRFQLLVRLYQTLKHVLVQALVMLLAGSLAQAAVVITVKEDGSGNVVSTAVGRLDTRGLTKTGDSANPWGFIIPSEGTLMVGPDLSCRNTSNDFFTGFMPSAGYVLGSGNSTAIPDSSGDCIVVAGVYNFAGQGMQITTTSGYNGGSLAARSVYSGQSISSLGLTPGIYTYSWAADTLTISIDTDLPDAPTVAAKPGNSKVDLSWVANGAGSAGSITGYNVQYRPVGGQWITTSFSGTGTSTTITGLAIGTNYEFAVAAINADGTGLQGYASATPSAPTPTVTGPTAPSNIVATAGIQQISISFTPSTGSGPITYMGLCLSASVTPNSWIGTSGTSSPLVITGAIAGASYTCSVDATDATGTKAAATPSASVIPSFPSPTVTANTGIQKASLLWTAVPGVTAYDVQYRIAGTSSWTPWAFAGTGTSTIITSLTAGINYEFSVAPKNTLTTGTAGTTTATVAGLTPTTQSLSVPAGASFNTIATFLTATGFSGNVSYSVSPTLPAGVQLNGATGQLFGFPTTPQAATTYTITGIGNTGGIATATATLTITAGSQTIHIGTLPSARYAPGSTFSVHASATSGLALSVSSSTPAVCTTGGSVPNGIATFTTIGAGTCTFTFTQAGDANFVAATPVSGSVNIHTGSQAPLIISATPASLSVGGTATLSATGGSGSGAVIFVRAGSSSSFCTVVGTTLTAIGVGQCQVNALKQADANYGGSFASNKMYVNIGVAAQAPLILNVTPGTLSVNSTSVLSTSGGSGSGGVTYTVDSGSCTINGTVLTASAQGQCQITAHKEADSSFGAAYSAPVSLTVNLASPPALVLSSGAVQIGFGGSTTLSTIGGISGGAVSYSVSGPCYVIGNTLTGTSSGTCTVTAHQAATSVFSASTSNAVSVAVAARNTTFSYAQTTATKDQFISITPTKAGFTNPTFGVIAGALPLGLTLNTATGVISGTPVSPLVTFSATISAFENNAYDAALAVIVVSAATTPPSVNAIPTVSEWNLIILSCLIAMFGLSKVRRGGRASKF
jgi:hypothetical protein